MIVIHNTQINSAAIADFCCDAIDGCVKVISEVAMNARGIGIPRRSCDARDVGVRPARCYWQQLLSVHSHIYVASRLLDKHVTIIIALICSSDVT